MVRLQYTTEGAPLTHPFQYILALLNLGLHKS